MNHHDSSFRAYSQQSNNNDKRLQYTALTLLFSCIAFYYGYSYIVYETTLKRKLYESVVWFAPSRFLRTTQNLLSRSHVLAPYVVPRQAGSNAAVDGQTQDGQTGFQSVVKKARTLSGIDRLIPQSIETTFPGLGNWDNSCYQNSVLQGLASLPAFLSCIEQSQKFFEETTSDAPNHDALNTFMTQLTTASCSRSHFWTPQILKSMNSWQQQDAQEYFSRIMEAVEKETIRNVVFKLKRSSPGLSVPLYADSERSSISRIDTSINMARLLFEECPRNPLDGSLIQSLKCKVCGFSEGYSVIPFNCLTLNLGFGDNCYLEDLLNEYTTPELIEGVECDGCTQLTQSGGQDNTQDHDGESEAAGNVSKLKRKGEKQRSTKAKQIALGRLPKDLALHVNRSTIDQWGEQRKNTSLINFPASLRISSDWTVSMEQDEQAIETVYELRSIITHQGRHDNGHYVACGRRAKDWYLFNDEVVTKTTVENVLERGNVFMLFYEQVNPSFVKEVETDTGSNTESESAQQSDETSFLSPTSLPPQKEAQPTKAV